MKIAVFVDGSDHRVLPISDNGFVEIYAEKKEGWYCINQIPFNPADVSRMGEVRQLIDNLVAEFADCELIVADGIKGIAKAVFEEFKIGIWHFKGFLQESLLDKIKDELIKVKSFQKTNIVSPVLKGTEEEAAYRINLAEVLEENSGLNSRDILIPFMQKTNFRQLIVVCDHLPKWFESTMDMLRLKYETFTLDNNQLQVTIEPINFETGFKQRRCVNLGGGCSGGCGF